MKKRENSYSRQIADMGNLPEEEKMNKIIMPDKKSGQMNSIGALLLWFAIFIILTISLGFFTVLAKLSAEMIVFLSYLFYFLIIVDGVFFIILIVLIINSIKRRGFE